MTTKTQPDPVQVQRAAERLALNHRPAWHGGCCAEPLSVHWPCDTARVLADREWLWETARMLAQRDNWSAELLSAYVFHSNPRSKERAIHDLWDRLSPRWMERDPLLKALAGPDDDASSGSAAT